MTPAEMIDGVITAAKKTLGGPCVCPTCAAIAGEIEERRLRAIKVITNLLQACERVIAEDANPGGEISGGAIEDCKAAVEKVLGGQ